jgi:rhamnosyltransferase subunit B
MRVAIVTLGSTGDLYPFLAVARELIRSGHEVHFLSQAPYEPIVRAEGVKFHAVVGAAEHRQTLEHPLLWHPLHGFGVLWRHLAVPAIESTCEILGELAAEGERKLAVLASPLAAGARFARDRWPSKIRLLSGYTAPMGLRSIDDPLFVGPWEVPRWIPVAWRQALWQGLDRWKLDPMARPVLTRWQQHWGTSRIDSSIFGDWVHSPDGGAAMYSSQFARVPDRWRANGVKQFDFPMFERRDTQPLPAHVSDFVHRHRDFVVVYPGSAAAHKCPWTRCAMLSAESLGLGVLILSSHLADGEGLEYSSNALFSTYLPLRHILPFAKAFIHHGGIGSVAEGLHRQVPQLVIASAYDQFENGARLQQLGAGRWLRAKKATTERVKRSLNQLLKDEPPEASAVPLDRPQPARGLTALAEELTAAP